MTRILPDLKVPYVNHLSVLLKCLAINKVSNPKNNAIGINKSFFFTIATILKIILAIDVTIEKNKHIFSTSLQCLISFLVIEISC